ncbi:hypothetical protein OPT61_g5579 [Boeremia exigua]|uniref:Uncharacterized protein n=1 Tax=Boeremia exigua TaxID=749465 RepID=A0ACC2I9U6_9PLEO|nr:hypothetical protein OPT61_g5579 [Boeremia exigua]
MHKEHDPSHLSGEATAGYALSTHVDMRFGLGETGDLLMDLGLPQPSAAIPAYEAQPPCLWRGWNKGGYGWLLTIFQIHQGWFRGGPRDDAGQTKNWPGCQAGTSDGKQTAIEREKWAHCSCVRQPAAFAVALVYP